MYPTIYTLSSEVIWVDPGFINTRSVLHELSPIEKAALAEVNRINLVKLGKILLSTDPILKRAGFSRAVMSVTDPAPVVVRLAMPKPHPSEYRVIAPRLGQDTFDFTHTENDDLENNDQENKNKDRPEAGAWAGEGDEMP